MTCLSARHGDRQDNCTKIYISDPSPSLDITWGKVGLVGEDSDAVVDVMKRPAVDSLAHKKSYRTDEVQI